MDNFLVIFSFTIEKVAPSTTKILRTQTLLNPLVYPNSEPFDDDYYVYVIQSNRPGCLGYSLIDQLP